MASDTTGYLHPLLTTVAHLKREATKRRKVFDELAVHPDEAANMVADGWEVCDTLVRRVRVRREKSIDERLENRFWVLLQRMGYQEMNEGRKFTVLIERKGAQPLRKQIDVFAKDEETVVVAECKASQRMTKRSLQKDVEEFANLKGPIAKAIHAHYGEAYHPKVIWFFVTENIIWSKPDKERAAGENIRVVTERELRYYAQVAEHLGNSARYQFLAEFLRDQQIPGLSGRVVPAIRGKLGGKKFYCFVTTPRHLLKIAFVNHRTLNDPDGAPTYQRLMSRSRMLEIADFIRKGGYFPNNILINFVRPVRFDKVTSDESAGVLYGQLYLPDRYRSAWVIDGQHRLYGYSPLGEAYLDENIVVLAFEDLPKEEEANLFVAINNKQKSVPKSLLDDLEGELKWGSQVPSERIGSIAARLLSTLNSDVGEPFHNRITQQGIASTAKTCLTVPELKIAIRRSGLIGKAVMRNRHYELGPLCGETDARTLDRARRVFNLYFASVMNANLALWESGREGWLCTNRAVQAYVLLLAALLRHWERESGLRALETEPEDLVEGISTYLGPMLDFLQQADDGKMRDAFRVEAGSGGMPEYYFRLCARTKTFFPSFEADGLADWESAQSEENIGRADRCLRDIIVAMVRYVFGVFRSQYGEEKGAYWEKGIADKQIKAKAYEKSLDDPVDERLPLEAYLDLVDIKRVVEHKQNWPSFKRVFDIPERGEKGFAKNLKWMDRLNELRRIPAHPSETRRYKADDFEYIDYVYDEFFRRLNEAEASALMPTGEDDDA